VIVVFGGYGTFGSLVARALAANGLQLRIASRDAERAARFASDLGPGHEGIAADASGPASCTAALAGAQVAVSCVGPFHADGLGLALPEACLATGVHYVDIADDRGWLARLRGLGERFRERGLVAACGCSSLPGISGALALVAAESLPQVERARITLFIGNANPKGQAAVASAASQLGRPFRAPQGTLVGLRGREVVSLPSPFGRRAVHDLDSPEYDLLPDLLGAREVRVKVGFESRLATTSFVALSYLGPDLGARAAAVLGRAAGLFSRFGHSGGFVQVELWDGHGRCVTASLGGPREGQRMAALPAAFVARDLVENRIMTRGFLTAWEALGARALLDRLRAAGFDLRVQDASR
jgi:Saccharopine dehydrogenase NADP binding domain